MEPAASSLSTKQMAFLALTIGLLSFVGFIVLRTYLPIKFYTPSSNDGPSEFSSPHETDAPLVFIHLKKVGGTSVRVVLGKNVYNYSRHSTEKTPQTQKRWTQPAYFGHLIPHFGQSAKELVDLFAQHQAHRPRLIALVRNPLDRVLSRYFWFRSLQCRPPNGRCFLGRKTNILTYSRRMFPSNEAYNTVISGFDLGACADKGEGVFQHTHVLGDHASCSDACPAGGCNLLEQEMMRVVKTKYLLVGTTERLFDTLLLLCDAAPEVVDPVHWREKSVHGALTRANLTDLDVAKISVHWQLDFALWRVATRYIQERVAARQAQYDSLHATHWPLQAARNLCTQEDPSANLTLCADMPSPDYDTCDPYVVPPACRTFKPCSVPCKTS